MTASLSIFITRLRPCSSTEIWEESEAFMELSVSLWGQTAWNHFALKNLQPSSIGRHWRWVRCWWPCWLCRTWAATRASHDALPAQSMSCWGDLRRKRSPPLDRRCGSRILLKSWERESREQWRKRRINIKKETSFSYLLSTSLLNKASCVSSANNRSFLEKKKKKFPVWQSNCLSGLNYPLRRL